ncbi:MAG: ATP synthase F1 subunit delta [Bacteroidia bacterium]
MSPQVVAEKYAQALFALAVQNDILEPTLQGVSLIQETYKTQRDFRLFLESPILPPTRKIEILRASLLPALNGLLRDFVILLTRRKREYLLDETCEAFLRQYRKYKGILRARLTSAISPSPALLDVLTQRLQDAFQVQIVEFETHVDASLVGGWVLEVEDKTADVSVAYALSQAQKKLLQEI